MKHEGSWLDLYLDYTSALESPTLYHRWVGLGVLGHAMGRRMWFPRGTKFPIFGAQMMVVLVGGSGIVRKTTAMNAGVDLLESLPLPDFQGSYNVLPNRTSAQKLIQEMTPLDENGDPCDAVALIAAAELGSFFSKESFNETLSTHIIPLNDAPYGLFNHASKSFAPRNYKIKYMSWEETLHNPCLGLIGCTTESGIARELPEQMLQGGFFGRVLWVWAEDTDRVLNPLVTIESENGDAYLQKAILNGLGWATCLRGPMLLTAKARRNFTEWYRSNDRLRELKGRDDGLQTGYWPRKDSHVLRVAMILNVAEIVGQHPEWKGYRRANEDSLTDPLVELPPIQWRQVETALHWLREIEAGRELCTREMGRTKRSMLPLKVKRMLERRKREDGWAERLLIIRRMNRSLGANSEEVDRALQLLLDTNQVVRRGKGKHTTWKVRYEAGPFGLDDSTVGDGPDPGEEPSPVEEEPVEEGE